MRFALLTSLCLLSACSMFSGNQETFELPPTTITPASQQWDVVPQKSDEPMMMAEGDAVKIASLKGDIARLQGELDALKPQMQKVSVIERHLNRLVSDLERIDAQYGLAAPQATPIKAPTPAKVKPKPPQKVAKAKPEVTASISGKKEIENVRFGSVNGATRVVLDLGTAAKFSTDLDNEEGILIIEVPNMTYDAVPRTRKSGVVTDVQGQNVDGIGRVILTFKDDVKITQSNALPPSGPYGHRIYLDLKPL